MPDLGFQVTGAAPVAYASTPMLGLGLQITNANPASHIHSIALRCQIQLEVTRRQYSAAEKEKLTDLFGTPPRWGQTLKPMLWAHVQTVVPSFSESTSVELQAPCSFDFNVAATKYFYGLETGEVPLCLMFSGMVFQTNDAGQVRVSPIPWDREARYRLPVAIWRQMIDDYYPNTAWLCLRRDIFDRLYQYRRDRGIPTFEQALDRILDEATKVVPL